LQTLELNAEYGITSTEPVMRRNVRDASAVALSHLSPSFQSVQYIGESSNGSGGPGYINELSFGYSKGEWSLDIMKRRCDTYVPSSRILEAWKVPGGQLEYCPGLLTLEAIYTSWPPV
jgi:hypothetical protein